MVLINTEPGTKRVHTFPNPESERNRATGVRTHSAVRYRLHYRDSLHIQLLFIVMSYLFTHFLMDCPSYSVLAFFIEHDSDGSSNSFWTTNNNTWISSYMNWKSEEYPNSSKISNTVCCFYIISSARNIASMTHDHVPSSVILCQAMTTTNTNRQDSRSVELRPIYVYQGPIPAERAMKETMKI